MEKSYGVLFVSSRNAARGILAEAILRHVARGRFEAFSAGADPRGEIDPFAVELLDDNQFPRDGLRSKSWQEFSSADAPRFHFVFNLCSRTARTRFPVWPWPVMQANWVVDDPSLATGDIETKRKAYWNAFTVLQRRIDLFTNLPLDSIDSLTLHSRMIDISNG